VLDELDHDERERLDAELEVKDAAIEFAKDQTKQNGFAPDITLQVFRHIRQKDALRECYSRAIGNRPGDDRGNWTKARINRAIGASVKAALAAASQTMGGNPLKVQVTGEFIRSYTPLEPGKGANV
jgi:hypothetical protein